MAKKSKRKKASYSADIDPGLIERWGALIEKEGLLKYRAVEAAFTLFLCCPEQLRKALINGNTDAVERWFADAQEGWLSAVEEALRRVEQAYGPPPPGRGRKGGGKR